MTETTAPTILQRDHRTLRGRIAYSRTSPTATAGARPGVLPPGRALGRQAHHHRALRDRRPPERDARHHLQRRRALAADGLFRPHHGRRPLHGLWLVQVPPGHTECETFTAPEGRISQRMEHRTPPLRTFQHHAIACDAWHLRLFDRTKGPGVQGIDEFLLSSPDHRGATGPMLFRIECTSSTSAKSASR